MGGSSVTSLRTGTSQGRWVLVGTIVGSGMAMLDNTVVNVALARIGVQFDARFTTLQWIANAYTLTLASLILLGGVLGDSFGRRKIFLIGAVWFTIASVLCAISPNELALIAARALQGIGAALLTPGSLSIISATFVATDRSRAVGIWAGLGTVANAAGPLLGGWLAGINWRLVFLINVPLAVLVIWAAVRHIPETRDEASSHRVDLPGTAAAVVFLGGLTYGLTTAGQRGWTPPVILALALGSAAGLAFVLIEGRARHPLIRVELFADRVFTVTNVVTLFLYAALSVFFLLLVLQLQLVVGWTPLHSGSAVLPITVLMLVLAPRFGALSDRIGPRVLMSIGTGLAAAGFVLALRIGPGAGYLGDVLPAVCCLGLGLSCTVAPLTSAVLGAAPAAQAGAASGINNAIARSAGLLAVAVIPTLAGLSRTETGDPVGFGHGFRLAMTIGVGLLLVAAAVSWFGLRRPTRPGHGPGPGQH